MIKNKYTVSGMLAILLVGCLSGCKDNDYYGTIVEQKVHAYEEVFLKEFGKIDPLQDWGFGALAATATSDTETAARRATRAIQPLFEFPEDADESKFLAYVPDGVEKLTENVARANNWIDETWEGDLYIWGGATAEGNWEDLSGGTLYIKGNCDFTNRKFYFGGHSELFLLEGATLTLNAENAANLQTYCNIYIAKNAKIVTDAELMLNNGLHIFNHGSIEAAKLSTNSDSWLVNSKTVKVSGTISVENEQSVIVNNGDIKAANLHTAGSGKFENNSNVTISDTTTVNSNDNTWVNNGLYKTKYFVYNAASDEVINNCRLIVDEDFDVNLGDNPGNGNFKMDAGSGVVTKNFNGGICGELKGGPFYIYMGSNSVFKVTETATMNATKADYGFYGPDSGDYAVLEAKNIVKGTEGQGFEVTYGGNLAVSAVSHFAQGNDGREDHPFVDIKGNAKVYAPGFEDGKPAITIEPTRCNPGFDGGGSTTPGTDYIPLVDGTLEEGWIQVDTLKEYYETTELIQQGRVFCEDLGQVTTNDLDFNDVVFDAYIYKTTQTLKRTVFFNGEQNEIMEDEEIGTTYRARIVLLAAGGTLQLTVAGVEVHNAFNNSAVTTIINTITDEEGSFGNSYNTFAPVELGFFEGYDSIAKIPIVVNYGSEILELKCNLGQAPHKIMLPIGTKWPKERLKMKDTYEQFGDYVNDSKIKFWEGSRVAENIFQLEGDTFVELSTDAAVPVLIKTEHGRTILSDGLKPSGGYEEGGEVLSRKK